MANTAGTLRILTLDGVSYNVMGDIDMTEIEGAWMHENLPTSGENVDKMTRRSQNREAVTVACNDVEFDALRELSERIEDFTISYTNAAGSSWTTTGKIDLENRSSANNKYRNAETATP